MATDNDALRGFNFPKTKGLFTTFDNGDEYKLRVLTTDPVVSTKEFEGSDGQVNLSTKFGFIVYNWTLEKAQILNAGATITKEIQRLHQDPDFGADIKKIDIKIRADGDKLTRRYTVTALPKAEMLTNDQIKECQAINLDEKIEGGQRMSFYNPEEKSGYEKAKEVRANLNNAGIDTIIEDEGDPIDLNDIGF